MSRYEDSNFDDYDGPTKSEIREAEHRKRNRMLDCRDPAHNGCPSCDDSFEEEEE